MARKDAIIVKAGKVGLPVIAIEKWETDQERVRRLMNIPPVKKLEWLRAMQEFRMKFQPSRFKKIAQTLRTGR